MVKKKLVALGVSALAITAVVGAGFSAWTFSTQRRADLNMGMLITEAASFGKMEVLGNANTVQLDQTKIGLGNLNGTVYTEDADKTISAKWTVNKSAYDANENDLQYHVSIYIKKATLGKYVTVNTGVGEHDFKTSTGDAQASAGEHQHNKNNEYESFNQWLPVSAISIDKDATVSDPTEGTSYEVTLNWTFTDTTFSYYAASETSSGHVAKPKTFAEYQSMVIALGGAASAADVVTHKNYNVAIPNRAEGGEAFPDFILEFRVYNPNSDIV